MGEEIDDASGESKGTTPTDADWIARVLDRVGVGVFVVDHAAQTVAKANDACARIVGAPSGHDLVGSSILHLYPDPGERAEIAARLLANEEFRRTGLARIRVRRIREDTREVVDLSIGLAADLDAEGHILRMDCVMQEIGDGRVDEQAFRLSEERFRVLFDTNHAAMALMDLRGHMTRVNPAFCRFVGRDPRELVGGDVLDLFFADDRPERPAPHDGVDGFALGERRFLRPDGQTNWGVVTGSWLSDGGDAPHSAMIVILDVTEKKNVEQSLQRIARLEALGQLAGGIAHDFNNVLAVVMLSIEVSLKQPELTPGTRELLNEAARAGKRSAALARQLLTFAKGGAPSKRAGSLGPVVREAAAFCLSGSKALVDVELAPDLWRCEFDAGQMSQVFNNLIINAVEAMPRGGRIRIEGRNVVIEPGAAIALAAGRYVRISVEDEGVGIDAASLDRIFDPYFTTKSTGSGLGLATAHSIVSKHGGLLTAENSPTRGSTVRAYLPATEAPENPDVAPALAPAAEALRGPARILFMDDEEGVRKTARLVLSMHGIESECVADGEHAVFEYRKALAVGRPFSAVILDLTIPGGMGGEEALERLRAIDPDVSAIVASGYAASPVMAEWRARGFVGALEKPFTADALAAVVGSALSQRRE